MQAVVNRREAKNSPTAGRPTPKAESRRRLGGGDLLDRDSIPARVKDTMRAIRWHGRLRHKVVVDPSLVITVGGTFECMNTTSLWRLFAIRVAR